MSNDRLHRWLTLAANVGVLIGIVFLALEIRQNSRHLALQLEFSEPTQKIFENNRALMEPSTAGAFAKAVSNPSELTLDEALIAGSLVLNYVNEWEDRYLLDQAELAGEIDWRRHVRENIDWTLGSSFAKEMYRGNRGAFEAEFAEYIDGLLDDVSDDGTYAWWTNLHAQLEAGDR